MIFYFFLKHGSVFENLSLCKNGITLRLQETVEKGFSGEFCFYRESLLLLNTKVKVRSPDGDTEYFEIVAGVLQGDMQAPYLFIICLDHVLRTSIDKIRENGFELTKKRAEGTPQKQLPTPTTSMT